MVAALFRFEISQEPSHLAAVVGNLLEWLKEPEQASLRRAFTVWFHRVLFADKPVPEKIGPLNELSEVRVMLAERVQEWKKEWKKEAIQEGLYKGRMQGRQEGRQEGMHEGKSGMLLQLLEYKFGTLEARIIERLQAANGQQLEEWGKRILTATELSDILITDFSTP
jgi:flagellar biosynthesis/type III secretory pathway protein FliH